jgi:hypothetical protein
LNTSSPQISQPALTASLRNGDSMNVQSTATMGSGFWAYERTDFNSRLSVLSEASSSVPTRISVQMGSPVQRLLARISEAAYLLSDQTV